jgi:heme/copper-type cytochrome/quinol oxidase subunit 2
MKPKFFILLIFLFLIIDANAQCAMCRAVLESGEDQSAAEGINDGIMFLMAVPYILVATIGYIIYRKYNKPNKTESID